MRAIVGLVLLAIAGAPRPSAAQWWVGLEAGTGQYRGTTRNTSGSSPSYLRPDRATLVGLRLSRQWAGVSATLRAWTGTPGIAGVAPGLTLTDRMTGRLLEIAPILGVTMTRIGATGALAVELGPVLDIWDIGSEMRPRVAGLGGLAYQWPIAGRFGGSIRAEVTLGSSVFDADELPPELERRATWRYGVALGLRYRL